VKIINILINTSRTDNYVSIIRSYNKIINKIKYINKKHPKSPIVLRIFRNCSYQSIVVMESTIYDISEKYINTQPIFNRSRIGCQTIDDIVS
jgi:hypothetical protein